ncbi:hypothetical protein, partial [Pedosphaera parvula]
MGKICLLVITGLFVLVTAKISSAANITWTNTVGGSWSDAMNWDLNRTPIPGDDVFINVDGTYAITVDNSFDANAQNVTIGAINGTQSLILTNNSAGFVIQGDLTVQTNGVCVVGRQIGYNQMVVNGKLFWLSGTLGGPLDVQSNGSLTITGGTAKAMQFNITNQGTITWAEPNPITGNFSSAIINQGLFILQTNLTLGFGADFGNSGTILQPAGTTNFLQNYAAFFTNSGTIHVETNALLTLGAAGFQTYLTDGTVISGPGLLRLDNISGTSALTASGNITVDGTFELFNGILRGTQTWTGPGTFNWTGGTMGEVGTTTIGTNFNFNISGFNQKFMEGHTLDNRGTVNWTSAYITSQNSPGTFINDSLLVLFQYGSLGASGSGSGSVFQNNGTLLCPASQGTVSFYSNWSFTNSGTLTVQSNSVLDLQHDYAGSLNFADGALLNGPGKTRLASSDLTASGIITVDGTFELAGQQQNSTGTLRGTQTWTGAGNFNWTGGGMAGVGTTTIGTNFNLNISGNSQKSLEGHTLDNRGMVNWTSAYITSQYNPGTFINDSLLVLFQYGSLGASGSGSGSVFQNNGTLLCPAGQGTVSFFSNWSFTNSGTLTVQSNSVLDLQHDYAGSLNFADGALLNGPGKTRLASSDLTASGIITVDGTFELYNGILRGTQTWTGPGIFNWTGGTMGEVGTTTVGTNFNLNISGSAQKSLEGHTLDNRGTVNWTSAYITSQYNPGTFINDSLLVLFQYGSLGASGSGSGSVFQNNGTLLCPASQGTVSFFSNWSFTNSGTLTVQSNSVLDLQHDYAGSLNFADGALLNGPGKTR